MTKNAFIVMLRQLTRYGIVGLLNNLIGYIIYILITWLWLDPKFAVTLMYPIGAVTAYQGHAKYSFLNSGRDPKRIARYFIAHLIGYGINIGVLHVFWSILGYPHQLVQVVAILLVAGVLFGLFRYFVFPQRGLES